MSNGNNTSYDERLVAFFLLREISNDLLRQKEMQTYRVSRLKATQFIENWFIKKNKPEQVARQMTAQVIEEYRLHLEKINNSKKIAAWFKGGAVVLIVMALLGGGYYYYTNKPVKTVVVDDNKLYCITPSGFKLHIKPGDRPRQEKRMYFGDSAINELDTFNNTWLKINIDGASYYAPKHYLKPYAIYKAIDSLYPDFHYDKAKKYELIHSKIAIRTVDVIRNGLSGSLEQWQIPFFPRQVVEKDQKRAVILVPKLVDSIDLPGEIIGFEKYHSVLLQKRNGLVDTQFVYQLLEFHLGPDAEVHLYKKREFNDRDDSCHILIKDVVAYRAGSITDNVFLCNKAGKTLARLMINYKGAETKEKIVFWEWDN